MNFFNYLFLAKLESSFEWFFIPLNLILNYFFIFLRSFYWLIIFFILAKIYFNYRNVYLKKKEKEAKDVKDWCFFELKLTKDTEGGPLLMENFLNGLKSFLKGYFVFEIVGFNKELHFYLRFPLEYQNILESLIYSVFPKLTIERPEDYFLKLPSYLPNREYDLWGTEFILEKNSSYPIKTYSYFQRQNDAQEILEPMTNLSEIVSKLNEREYYIIQFFFRPLNSDEENAFTEEGRSEIDIALGKKTPEKKITTKDWVIAFIINLLTGIYREPVWPEEGEKKEPPPPSFSQTETANFINKKINKKCFEVGIRVLYLAPKNIFTEINTLGFLSYFNQFDFKNLNSFKVNDIATTFVEARFFGERKLFLKKLDFFKRALKREWTLNKFILNTEELSTVVHLPSLRIKLPSIPQVLFRKGEPPPYLPT